MIKNVIKLGNEICEFADDDITDLEPGVRTVLSIFIRHVRVHHLHQIHDFRCALVINDIFVDEYRFQCG
jgi:hypothetical protein